MPILQSFAYIFFLGNVLTYLAVGGFCAISLFRTVIETDDLIPDQFQAQLTTQFSGVKKSLAGNKTLFYYLLAIVGAILVLTFIFLLLVRLFPKAFIRLSIIVSMLICFVRCINSSEAAMHVDILGQGFRCGCPSQSC